MLFSRNQSIKSQFLSYFLAFYGNFFFYLTLPLNSNSCSKSKLCFKNKWFTSYRQFYHIFIFGLFNWICEQPNSSHKTLLAVASQNGKPLPRLSFRLFDVTYRSLSAIAMLYCLCFGPEIIKLLNKLDVLSEQFSFTQKSDKTRLAFGGLFLIDHAFFYLLKIRNKKFSLCFNLQFLSLFIDYIHHFQSTIFFRLLAYKSWATWKAFSKNYFIINKEKIYQLSRNQMLYLVKLNRKLTTLLSLPLFCELISHCLETIWSLCFTKQINIIQMVRLSVPFLVILWIDWFSRKTNHVIVTKSNQMIKKQIKNNNKLKTNSLTIYWYQVGNLYSSYFYSNIFNLVTVNASFALHIILLLANYSLLINQTT